MFSCPPSINKNKDLEKWNSNIWRLWCREQVIISEGLFPKSNLNSFFLCYSRLQPPWDWRAHLAFSWSSSPLESTWIKYPVSLLSFSCRDVNKRTTLVRWVRVGADSVHLIGDVVPKFCCGYIPVTCQVFALCD